MTRRIAPKAPMPRTRATPTLATSPGARDELHPPSEKEQELTADMLRCERGTERYQTLQAYEESPQLPSGYATMILLAFLPPVWRAVMHPRLMRFRATQKGQIWRHGPSPSPRPRRGVSPRRGGRT